MSAPRVSIESQIAAIDSIVKGNKPTASVAELRAKHIADAKATLRDIDRDKEYLNACRLPANRPAIEALLRGDIPA